MCNRILVLAIIVFSILPGIAKDNKEYESVKIGKQVWMKKNLDVDHYRNGDPIPEVKKSYEWAKLTTGAWCYYENKPKNGKIYGKLYNWFAVNDPRGLAPEGWHIPTDEEWQELVDYVGGEKVAGGILKEAGLAHWKSPNEGATNESEFSALPGGCRHYYGTFDFIGGNGGWWSSTEYSTTVAWYRGMGYGYADVFRYDFNKENGFSVRCIRD